MLDRQIRNQKFTIQEVGKLIPSIICLLKKEDFNLVYGNPPLENFFEKKSREISVMGKEIYAEYMQESYRDNLDTMIKNIYYGQKDQIWSVINQVRKNRNEDHKPYLVTCKNIGFRGAHHLHSAHVEYPQFVMVCTNT